MNELELYHKCLESIIVLNDGRLDDLELGTIYTVVKRILSELPNPTYSNYILDLWFELHPIEQSDLTYIHDIISEITSNTD